MEDLTNLKHTQRDPWTTLRQHTAARIGLSGTSTSIGTKQTLAFRLDHAHARDAVYSVLDVEQLQKEVATLNMESIVVQSQAANREEYVQRPDRGRRLGESSWKELSAIHTRADVVLVLGDGLSAEAITRNAIPVLRLLQDKLREQHISVYPVVIAEQARVALADDIGSALHATLSVIFIGERPGLSSPDSMGVYLTYNPQPGTTDEARNCISNIRAEGLRHNDAVEKILYFITECLRLKRSGVRVKDHMQLLL